MDTKLTLKLNKRVIERAKKYAKRNKQSLSGMVENYFNMIAEKDTLNDLEISPNVLELSGKTLLIPFSILFSPLNYSFI